MKSKMLFMLLLLLSFISCSEDDGVEPYEFNPNTDSFLDGEWKGNAADETKTLSVTAQLNEAHNIIGGTIVMNFSFSDETSQTINISHSGTVSGNLVNSQMSFGSENSETGNTFLYNGSVSKNDSTLLVGNARIYYSTNETSYTINLNLKKQ